MSATTTITTALRNALADLIDTTINAGTTDASGDFQILDDPSALVTIPLNNPSHGAASGGVITLDTTGGLEAAASGTGTADIGRFRDRDNTEVIRGNADVAAGTPAVTLTNTSINSGQTCRITSGTITIPASVTV